MPRFRDSELNSIKDRLRGLERKIDSLDRQMNPYITIADFDFISVDNDVYTKKSELIYQTKKDSIVDQVDGEARYGHKVLNLNADGTGDKLRVARVYWSTVYTTLSTTPITWEIVDGEVIVSE